MIANVLSLLFFWFQQIGGGQCSTMPAKIETTIIAVLAVVTVICIVAVFYLVRWLKKVSEKRTNILHTSSSFILPLSPLGFREPRHSTKGCSMLSCCACPLTVQWNVRLKSHTGLCSPSSCTTLPSLYAVILALLHRSPTRRMTTITLAMALTRYIPLTSTRRWLLDTHPNTICSIDRRVE